MNSLLMNPYAVKGTPAPPSLVQQKVATVADGSAGVTATFDTPLTAGNCVVAFISFVATGGPAFVVEPILVDGGAESLASTLADSEIAALKVKIFYVFNVAGGETALTFSLDLPVRASVNVAEFVSGGINTLDTAEVNTGVGIDSVQAGAGAVNPGGSPALIVAMYSSTLDRYSSGPTDGFTRLAPTGGTGAFQEAAYLIQLVGASINTGWTLSGSDDWASGIVPLSAV